MIAIDIEQNDIERYEAAALEAQTSEVLRNRVVTNFGELKPELLLKVQGDYIEHQKAVEDLSKEIKDKYYPEEENSSFIININEKKLFVNK